MPRITPNLWFDTEARTPPTSTSRSSRTRRSRSVSHYGESAGARAGSVLTVDF